MREQEKEAILNHIIQACEDCNVFISITSGEPAIYDCTTFEIVHRGDIGKPK